LKKKKKTETKNVLLAQLYAVNRQLNFNYDWTALYIFWHLFLFELYSSKPINKTFFLGKWLF